jgi:hypothetical protein
MTTMLDTPTIAPAFTLDVTRRVYAIDCMTGERIAYFVRNYTIVG